MKTINGVIILIMLASLLAACQANAPAELPVVQKGSREVYNPAGNMKSMDSSSPSAPQAQADRIVIKNANLSLVVEKPFDAMGKIISLSMEMGGYVVNSRTYKTTADNNVEVPEAEVTIRVLSEKLDQALEKIRALVKDSNKDILSESITGQDITMEYIDLKSRLATYEQTEKQLMRIQETATKVDDVLNILTRLNDIRQQIESLKGQIKYYDESTKLSAITVRLVAAEGINPLTIGGWQPLGVARDALQALIVIGQFLVNALIVLVIVGLPLFAVFFFPIRWILRKTRKNQSHPSTFPHETNQPQTPPDQMRTGK